MHVRVGVTDTPKELDVEMAEGTDPDQLRSQIEAVLSSGEGLLWLTDRRGRTVGVPAGKVAWIDLATDDAEPRIGFGT
jgi:hypothetical protein